jgi:hypothetical protein
VRREKWRRDERESARWGEEENGRENSKFKIQD